ncbi:MAG TPA: MFS transporter [Bryobacteraceae bacterium]|nr:MFS transporter [Bryobacteraceae bacterium]
MKRTAANGESIALFRPAALKAAAHVHTRQKITGGFLRHLIATSTTIRIIHTSLFVFLYYLTIGLLLAVLPGFVHLHLGFSPFWAGVAISSQYLATLVTRSKAGRMTDVLGPRTTVLIGQVVGLLSGLCLVAAASLQSKTVACFVAILISRLILGCGESCVATGSTTWGLGRVGAEYAAQVISWSGIASYGAMAAGAPLGIWFENRHGLESIGAAASGVSVLNLALALPLAGVPILRGARLAFSKVLGRLLLHGLGLTLGTVGFATIASFTGLYYASRHWTDPALALILFGSCFIITRLLFAGAINRWNGFRVALVSFIVESAGLFVLWSATTHDVALAGAALSGCGFALVFPALGVEALKMVADQNHGAALGVYTAFLDLAMGVTGPIAGVIVGKFGYSALFLYGSGAAGCAFVLTLLLYHVVREPLSRKTLEPLEIGETR